MNELSLFTGAGGGLLATQHLLEFTTIGYVEIDDFCQRIISQRIKDGFLHNAPIFTDIKAFIDSGCAELYRGITDLVTAGFPCQPFSIAGQRKAEQDERNLWPDTIKCLRIVQPRYAFLENVLGLLATDYIRRIYGDLAEAGYDARWCVLGADDCGAPHRRKRWWVFAYPTDFRLHNNGIKHKSSEKRSCLWKSYRTTDTRIWLKTHGAINRNFNGISYNVDRLKAIGNGQVPEVARTAWNILNKDWENEKL